jgi:hypothetical protein
MILTIDNKIQHLKELDFLERELFGFLNPESFYKDLSKFLFEHKSIDLKTKSYLSYEETKLIDGFVQKYFETLLPLAKTTIIRAYIIGRLLAESDKQAKIFRIDQLNKMPKYVQEAVKKYGLSIEEAKTLEQAVERGAGLLSNTVTNTQQTVKNTLVESLSQRQKTGTIAEKLKGLVDEIGELNRDWQRVAISETNDAFNNGYLSALSNGDYVVGISMPDACPHCIELIDKKVYRLIGEPPPDYSTLTGEEYLRVADIYETCVWVGKSNFGRSTAPRKRIDKTRGNAKDNLEFRKHHELSMPVIPLHPQCFKGDVEVYTAKGWRRFDKLEKGVKVATFNMITQEMEFQKPYEYIEYNYKGKMIRFYSERNIDIAMTEGHNVLTAKRPSSEDRTKKHYRLIPANELKGEIIIPISCNYNKITKGEIVIGKHHIDEFTYASLMGYFLSEGSCKSKKHGWEVKITQHKEESNKKIFEDLKNLNVKLRKYSHSIQFNDKDICTYLKKFGKSYEKYIPLEIKNISKEGLKTFIDAYVLGDGNTKHNKLLKGQKNQTYSRVIYTTSKQLADDFTEVIMKAGYSCSYKLIQTKGKTHKFNNGIYTLNHDTWRISIKTSKYINYFQKEEFQYNGKVYCVTVPNQTILVRSNGKVLWIGNCRCRWVAFNPRLQWIDKDGNIRLSVEDKEAYKKWYEENILGFE